MYHRTRASSVHYPIAKKTKDSSNGMINLAEVGGPPPHISGGPAAGLPHMMPTPVVAGAGIAMMGQHHQQQQQQQQSSQQQQQQSHPSQRLVGGVSHQLPPSGMHHPHGPPPPPPGVGMGGAPHHLTPAGGAPQTRSGSARERAMHAVEYYKSNVRRARVDAGLARNSLHERYSFVQRQMATMGNGGGGVVGTKLSPHGPTDHLYRSNSSLELIHDHGGAGGLPDHLHTGGGTNLRREYGSHGSIDVISSDRHPHHHHHHQGHQGGGAPSAGENFLTMLQEYQPFGLDASSLLYSLGKHHSGHGHGNGAAPASSNITLTGDDVVDRGGNASPKLRNKFHRLWGSSNGASAAGSANGSANGKRQVANGGAAAAPGTASLDDSQLCMALNVSASSTTTTVSSADIEERQRRRAFAHFDCRSLTANLGYAAKLRGFLLERRRNTTTGASAAATYGTRSSTPDGDSVDEDYGDGQQNELLENCPFFRNEIGGEEEREVSLTRMASSTTSSSSSGAGGAGQQRRAIHRPALAYGVSVLECGANDTLWKGYTCPYQKGPRPIEQIDNGALYYRQYFFGQEHQNWFGMDEHLGPVAISIKREKLNPAPVQTLALHGSDVAPTTTHQGDQYLYRLIVRTSELLTLRGSVIEDSIPNARGAGKHANTKEILEYVAPEVQIGCLRLAVGTPQCEQQLLKLDEQGLTNKYKVGILYCRAGQSSEEDMYNNEEAGPAFNEFLDTIGRRVRLKGFEHYKAGLDNKTDSTGTHSLYATHQDCEIMFHVSTMLPFTPNNRQQLLRKRHIGNDIVTIVFQEPGALPFTPKNIRSQFQHVFVIVRAVNPCSEHTQYRVAVSRSKDVPVFGPPVRAGSHYPRSKQFGEFLLSKVINAENAAHRSVKFAMMAIRTRQEYLKDLATNYSTAQVVETGQRFSIFPSKKRERPTKPRFSGDLSQRGAFCWQVVLHDSGQSTQVDCFLGISAETFVLIEECTRQIIFVTPCRAILGWSTSQNALRVYYHQGECVTLNMRDTGDRDEQLEVIERLRAVTNGCGALELSLRRNPMGQLGFHVQPDGVVTQVEISGQAWAAGLRQGYRLVEICKVAVATLSHDQMVDLLKTSAQVTVTVIESFADFTPRRGCTLQNCRFNSINYENEYDSMMLEGGSGGGGGNKNGSSGQNGAGSGSIGSSSSSSKKGLPGGQLQSSASHRRRYERNFSPPRSSNSSGYGTGSSSRSFTAAVGASGPQQVAGAAAAAAAASSGVAQPNGPDMGTLTSSSSGHSSNDERWYDVLDPPQEASSLMAAGPPSVASDPSVNYHHPKLTSSSNSLPLAGSSPRPLSLHNEGGPMSASPARSNGGQQSGAANGQSVGRDNSANIALLKRLIIADSPNGEVQQQQQHHQQQQNHTEPLYSSSLKNLSNHHLLMSAAGNHVEEDDLSRHNSPQLRRSATTTNIYGINGKKANGAVANCSGSSASSSRNNSPRPNGQGEPAKLRGGAALKGGAQHHPQRNSVNYTTGSTLQEDLMKLINPDYIANDDNFNAGGLERMQKGHHNSHSLGNIASLAGGLKPIPQKSRSREGVNLGGSNQQLSAANGGNGLKLANGGTNSPSNSNGGEEEVIFTTARPATVISSTTSNSSSPASELLGKHHMNEDHLKMSPSRKQQLHQQQQQQQQFVNGGGILRNGGGKIPLPDMKEMDWSSLVDTATKAMTQLSETVAKSHPGSNVYYDDISQVLNGVHNQHQLQQHPQQQSGHNGTMNGGGNGPLGTIVNGGGGGAGGSSSVSGTGSSIGSGVDLSSSTPSSASPVSTGSSSTAAAQQQALMALQNSSSLPELQCQVTQLSDRVLREQRRRRSLEHAVKRLTEENRRLQDESQAAVQQLRRFTEWFFQTIDRQS